MTLPNSSLAIQNSRSMPEQCRKLIKDMFGDINCGPKGVFPTEADLRGADSEDLLYYVSWMARFKSEKARKIVSNNW